MSNQTVTPGMELKDFITQTMTAIIEAMDDFKSLAEERDRRIVYGENVEFDISLTVIDSDQGRLGIGVLSAVLNAGISGKEETSIQSAGRVKFAYEIKPILNPYKND